MIRYDITEAELWRRINRLRPTWRSRAANATALFRRAGTYGEPEDTSWDTHHGVPPKPFWGEIKRVYMRLQKNKCAFCERKLPPRTRDHDVEHFRPKRGVEPWPPLPSDPPFPQGYYLLAYHPLNYVTSCPHCNQDLKRSYFPIESARLPGKDRPRLLKPERPLLIYPIGRSDTNPEDLLGFKGIAPGPTDADPDSRKNRRAQGVIDLFELADREELLRERSEVIESLHAFLVSAEGVAPGRQRRAQKIIERMQSDGSHHTNCARCFVALYHDDPEEAERLADCAADFLDTLD